MWDDDEEGSLPGIPNRESAAVEADLRAYFARKRSMAVWSVGLACAFGVALAAASPIGAIALVFGALCGVANALLTMRGNERLLDHRSVASFVISSVLRIIVFGIVPVEFGLHGPWWTIGAYFVGFFTPLALYAFLVARFVRTG